MPLNPCPSTRAPQPVPLIPCAADGSADDPEVERRVRLMNWGFVGDEWKPISREAKQLIRRLLDVDPAKRATVSEVLASPWVGGEAASATPLPAATASRLRDFNEARRLWRAAIRAAALVGRAPATSDAMAGRRVSREGLPPEALEELRAAFKACAPRLSCPNPPQPAKPSDGGEACAPRPRVPTHPPPRPTPRAHRPHG